MAREFKYWAFISYSHADKKWATGAALPRRPFPIIRDREELPTSSDLSSMISQALRQSRCLIAICSPRAARSRWVN